MSATVPPVSLGRLRSAGRRWRIALAAVVALTGCVVGTAPTRPALAQMPAPALPEVPAPPEVDHGAFDRVLRTYVDADGRVDYAALAAHAADDLLPYLQRLGATDPSTLSDEARLAFWINAYNAFTLKLIVDHYPVERITAIQPESDSARSSARSPFEIKLGTVAGAVRSLDDIEHGVIRERFDEPRIHFALVCAAVSCPPLRREAYTGPRLDAQLDAQARVFLHDTRHNRIPAADGVIRISKLFAWFEDDFDGTTDDVQRFLAPYFDGDVRDALSRAAYRVEYLDYDWSLND